MCIQRCEGNANGTVVLVYEAASFRSREGLELHCSLRAPPVGRRAHRVTIDGGGYG